MAMVVLILKAYLIFVILVMGVYAIRHYVFTLKRLRGEQRLFYQDIIDADLPMLTVIIPMHNEELVAERIIGTLLDCEYPRDRLEIIPVNDNSEDGTGEILDRLAAENQLVRPIHRERGPRGKPVALNEGVRRASGEIVLVFDADYFPSKGALRDLAVSFKDPEVGAVMGRVVPMNTKANLLTRLLDLERSGGYQVDQQARHNLKVIPQYGGTVGGFRRSVILALGGFHTGVLAEDTDLTFRLLAAGWKVAYANRVECYETVPENWPARSKQIRRWSRGHNQVMFRRLFRVMRSAYLSRREKLDGFLLLTIYTVPVVLLTGIIDSIVLFFMGRMDIVPSLMVILFIASYNSFGNFAPFFQIGTATLLDGTSHRIRLLPMLMFYFLLNIWNVTVGFFQALLDLIVKRDPEWDKTDREEDRTRHASA